MTFWDQGTPKDPYRYIKTKKIKIGNIHCERGFFTFWTIMAHSVTPLYKANILHNFWIQIGNYCHSVPKILYVHLFILRP